MSFCKTVSCLLVVFSFCTPSADKQLTAIYSSTKLPIPDHGHSLWYDGADSVYLFGGSDYLIPISVDRTTPRFIHPQ